MAYENYRLDIQGYRHPLRTIKTYCISTASIVKRKLPNVAFIRTLLIFFFNIFPFCRSLLSEGYGPFKF